MAEDSANENQAFLYARDPWPSVTAAMNELFHIRRSRMVGACSFSGVCGVPALRLTGFDIPDFWLAVCVHSLTPSIHLAPRNAVTIKHAADKAWFFLVYVRGHFSGTKQSTVLGILPWKRRNS